MRLPAAENLIRLSGVMTIRHSKGVKKFLIALSSSNPFDIYFQLGILKSFGEQPVIFLNNRLKYCGF